MKIIGKNSLIYWLRIPISIYVFGFLIVSAWIISLMAYYSITQETNQFISIQKWGENNKEYLQFHYPFTKMVLATSNTLEGIGVSFLGLVTICFILFYSLKIIFEISKEKIFSSTIIKYFNYLGFGLIILGGVMLLFDLITSINKIDLTPSILFLIIGLVLLLIKSIIIEGKNIQDENDLTI